MENNFKKTKTGKYYRYSHRGDFKVYYTEEKYKAVKKMYDETPKPKLILTDFLCHDFVKYTFCQQLKKVLKDIQPNFDSGWIRHQTGLSHSCIIRTLNGTIVPTVENFYKFLFLIYIYKPNFNIWFLLDKDAPMLIDKDYKPFCYRY